MLHGSDDHIKEACGLFGIYDVDGLDTAQLVYCALYALQHRGQESCGIAVNDDNKITCYKDLGLLSDVFNEEKLAKMKGSIAMGHVRYSTTGSNGRENAQPLASKYVKGTLTLAHNGNISNAHELHNELIQEGAVFQTSSDTELIAYLIARARLVTPSIEAAVELVMPKLRGSFSLIVMSPRKLIAVRDPYGIRPLCMGKIKNSYVFSSESCALNAIGADFIRDIDPGEILAITPEGIVEKTLHCKPRKDCALCIFEHIYFARQDSVIDGQSVYEARLNAGRLLAQQNPVEADVVTAVPDSGITAAIGFAHASGIPYGEGLVKNRYIGRTFIQPTQSMREHSIDIKLSALKACVKGKRVVMIDDSIVRGTTMRQLVAMLKKAGAKEVHIRISSPQFLWPCYFGTDIPQRTHLACYNYNQEQLKEHLGADSLHFLSMKALKQVVPNSTIGFCDACFSGHYPFEVPSEADKLEFEICV
ncbi:MAG: amidophosphoribosyltransferase [Christensenellales bacterium]|jgi:amidophosphoribosyltransferase